MSKVKMSIVFLFCVLIIGSLTIFASNDTKEETEVDVSEQLPHSTITSIAQITNKHLIENAVLDIQVTPIDDKEKIVLKLQTTEFLTEDMLLKNTYNMLQDMQQLSVIQQITIAWYMLLKTENTEVLTITFDATALTQVQDFTASQLPTFATTYTKHDALKTSR